MHKARKWRMILLIPVLVMMLLISEGGTSMAASTPNWNNDACYGTANKFPKYNCSWYVWGRVKEVLGISLSTSMKQWVNSSVTGGYTQSPSTNSIAIYAYPNISAKDSIMHVLFVENVSGTNVTYSEGNYGGMPGPQKYHSETVSLSNFAARTKKDVAASRSFGPDQLQLLFVPLSKTGTAQTTPSTPTPTGTPTVTTGSAEDITTNNAILYGHVTKPAGMNISTCGIYLGTSSTNMMKRKTETVTSGANAKDGGTGFDIWYNVQSELNMTLDPNTTYYYKIFCTYGGNEYAGSVKSFKTANATKIFNRKVRVRIPANYALQFYQTADSTANYKYKAAVDHAYDLPYDILKYAVRPNGSIRFCYKENGEELWFDNNSRLEVHYAMDSLTVKTTSLKLNVGETAVISWSMSPTVATEEINARDIATDTNGWPYLKVSVDQKEHTASITALKVGTTTFRLVGNVTGSATSKTITVTAVDTAPPTISDVVIESIDEKEFKVRFTSIDNIKVEDIGVQIWNSASSSKPSIRWRYGDNMSGFGQYNDSYHYTAQFSDYGNRPGIYNIGIYAKDKSGNTSDTCLYVRLDPPKVANLQVRAALGHADLSWQAVMGATGYSVYRRESGGSWQRLDDVAGTSFSDETVQAGEDYYYTVEAFVKDHADGESELIELRGGYDEIGEMITIPERETDPGTGDPGTSDPGTGDPGTTDPGTTTPDTGGAAQTPTTALTNPKPNYTVGSIVNTFYGTYRITSQGSSREVSCETNPSPTAGSVFIPNSVEVNGVSYQVTSVAPNAFKNSKKLKYIELGSSICTIGDNAFANCPSLKTVAGGSGLTVIGKNAFAKCKKLTKITLGKNVVKIGKKAFFGCKSLKKIIIKSTNLKKGSIGGKAFAGISAKATIKVPKKSLKSYQKILRAKGVGKKVKITK